MNASEQHPHLAAFFDSHQMDVGSIELARLLEHSLSLKPWTAEGLDWNAIGNEAWISLDDLISDTSFAVRSGFKGCQIAAAFLRSSEPPIIAEPAILFAFVDQIFWKYPGRRYIFGCVRDGSNYIPSPRVLAEYDGADGLRFIEQAISA